MGQKFRDEAGNVWEMDDGGQPRLVSPAAGGPQVVMPAVQDPLAPYKLKQEQGQAAAAPFAAPKAQADATIAQANAGTAGTVAQAEAAKAQADARKAEFELKKLQAEQAKVDPKSGAYKALQIQIDRVSELYRQNLQGILPNSINDIIPDMIQPGVGAFDSAAQGLVNPFMAAFKVPGQGSQSDTELRQFLAANTPEQGDSDAVIEEKLRTIQTRLDAEIPPALAQTDKSAPLVGNGQQPDAKSFSTDGFRDEIDPVLKGVAGRLGKMVAAGASDSVVMEFLRKNGVDPANTNIQGVLQHRRTPEYKAWQRANPGKPYPIGAEFYTNKVPLSATQDIGNKVGQSGFGAFMINAGQGASGNRLDNLAGILGGDPEAVNTGVQLSRANSPTASFLGDLSGQIMAQGAMNRIPGLSRLPGSSTGRMADDALYGAYAGQGDEEVGAGMGALTNMIGGKVGRGAQAAGKVAAKGVNAGPSLNYLNNAEIPLTIGQIGRGTNSTVGNVVGGIEERAAGLPIFDAIIGSARKRGDEGFNSAAFREMGGSGATGAAGIVEGKGLVNNAYNFLDNSNFPIDAQFAGRNAGAQANLPRNLGGGIADRLDDINASVDGGVLSGRDWQSAVRGVRADRASIKGQPFSDKATDALSEVEDNLMGLARRQGPPGTIANLSTANTLNGRFQTLASALDNGPAQARGELFSPTRLDTASRAGARNFGGRVNSMAGNRPFYDLTKAGMDVMPNLTPDSGTAGRALFYSALPGILGGGIGAGVGAASDGGDPGQGAAMGTGYGSTLLPTLALAALYSKGGQKGIQKALLGPRPKILDKAVKALDADNFIAKGLKKALGKRSAGMFGSALARDLFLYPELEQGF